MQFKIIVKSILKIGLKLHFSLTLFGMAMGVFEHWKYGGHYAPPKISGTTSATSMKFGMDMQVIIMNQKMQSFENVRHVILWWRHKSGHIVRNKRFVILIVNNSFHKTEKWI